MRTTALLLLALAASAAAQTPADLLNNPALKPFVEQILATPECLTDLATTQFDISQCPGLLAMLDALNLGNTNPPVNCELSCVEQFNLLSEGCVSELVTKLASADDPVISRLTTAFFSDCDAEEGGNSTAPAPAPAPVPASEGVPIEAPEPSEPAGDVPAPEATYVPPSGVAGMLPMALLSVLPLMAAGALLLA